MVTVDGEELSRRYDLLSASPSAFKWGHSGSRPAQLAVTILFHAYGDEFATKHYQRFNNEVVAALPESRWTLTTLELEEWRRGSLVSLSPKDLRPTHTALPIAAGVFSYDEASPVFGVRMDQRGRRLGTERW